jgi:hypothetical protein
MGWFTKDTDAEANMRGTLTDEELIALGTLEAKVDAAVEAARTVLEAGKALAEIRNRQLFRDTAATWDGYCQVRFRMTKRRADQMIAFAGVRDAIEEMGTSGSHLSERATRPLVGMAADTIREVVAEAAGSDDGITPATIRKAATRRKAKAKATKVRRPQRFKVPGATIEVRWNKKASGSVIEALQAAIKAAQADQAADAA